MISDMNRRVHSTLASKDTSRRDPQVFPTSTLASRSPQEAAVAAGVTPDPREGSERGVSDPCCARVLDRDGEASPYLRPQAAIAEELAEPFDVLQPERKEEDRAEAGTVPDPWETR
ncbi:hypothetical protein NDU88_005367 [Pleurodeles waltl]|uniref:Uncharacterized protein n=1 Tax=Pleurodeles waltl TaxID=8319 RepID=A0AAV7UIH1_PLEWA|nr:hypothetical protein NDU88_005367 [Pleurodeles waltl]